MKRPRVIIFLIGIGILFTILFTSIHVSATNVTIDANLSVSPNIISFETVFPGEILLKPINIDLGQVFLQNPILDDVEYRIIQKPKPRIDTNGERFYCGLNPTDYTRCYPSLCPFLSKTPADEDGNDYGIPAFHDPNDPGNTATGRLAKSENDTEDKWIIDLHVPCFEDQCDQSKSVPPEYQLDPAFKGEVFGCDLVIEVTEVSFNQCVPEPITVVGSIPSDPTPLIVNSYNDIGNCTFVTNDDVIIEGDILYPPACNHVWIEAPTLKVATSGSITYTKGGGAFVLKSTSSGITIEGDLTSASKEPIRIESKEGILVHNTTIHNTNGNGDIKLEAQGNILISTSILTIGDPPPATTGGDRLTIQCFRNDCRIQIESSTLNVRELRVLALQDILMYNSTLNGRDPRGNYIFESKYGNIDLRGGECGNNRITNPNEGNLTITAKKDIRLDDIFIRIPEHIKVTSGTIISMLRSDISNDFGKKGDIIMTANNNTGNIFFNEVSLIDDNEAQHNFAELNGGDDPLDRASYNVAGVATIDN